MGKKYPKVNSITILWIKLNHKVDTIQPKWPNRVICFPFHKTVPWKTKGHILHEALYLFIKTVEPLSCTHSYPYQEALSLDIMTTGPGSRNEQSPPRTQTQTPNDECSQLNEKLWKGCNGPLECNFAALGSTAPPFHISLDVGSNDVDDDDHIKPSPNPKGR